jgi:hypothetical protein
VKFGGLCEVWGTSVFGDAMATMESLIGLVNRIQRACTVLGDYGGGDSTFSSLWEALPSVAVVGGQVLFDCFLIFSLELILESESEVSREREKVEMREFLFIFCSVQIGLIFFYFRDSFK